MLTESDHIEMFGQFGLIGQKVCYFTYFVNVSSEIEKDPKVDRCGNPPQLHTASVKDEPACLGISPEHPQEADYEWQVRNQSEDVSQKTNSKIGLIQRLKYVVEDIERQEICKAARLARANHEFHQHYGEHLNYHNFRLCQLSLGFFCHSPYEVALCFCIFFLNYITIF